MYESLLQEVRCDLNVHVKHDNYINACILNDDYFYSFEDEQSLGRYLSENAVPTSDIRLLLISNCVKIYENSLN